jgi:hypothetical protein
MSIIPSGTSLLSEALIPSRRLAWYPAVPLSEKEPIAMRNARTWLVLSALLFGYASLGFAQGASVAGEWTMTFQTDQGAADADMALKVDGQKVSGTITSPQGQAPLEGTVADGKLTMTLSIDACGQSFTMSFNGIVTGDSMKGDVDFGGFGTATWTAVRKK